MDIREVVRRMIKKYKTDDTEFLSITIQKDESGSIVRESYNDFGQVVFTWSSLQELIHELDKKNEIRN